MEVVMSEARSRRSVPSVRVEDKVLQTFEYASAMGDLETAAKLLEVLKACVQRKVRRFGGDRRQLRIDLDAARERLEGVAKK
jgi:hypothetical protein